MPASTELFKHYKGAHKFLIETGTFSGIGTEAALAAGMAVKTIELHPFWFERATTQFKDKPVEVFFGDSAEVLTRIMDSVYEPVMFWLDAHYSGEESKTARGRESSPLLRELNVIWHHSVKTHTILIDDVRLMATQEFDGITLGSVVEAIWKINPKYRVELTTGQHDYPNDVLAAYI